MFKAEKEIAAFATLFNNNIHGIIARVYWWCFLLIALWTLLLCILTLILFNGERFTVIFPICNYFNEDWMVIIKF